MEWASMAEPEPPPRPESGLPSRLRNLIPGYELVERLGRGGMGEVYRGRQLGLDRGVAIKILKPDLAQDPGYVERFLREARTAGKLRHLNLVSALDCGEAGGHYFIAMELIEGRPLDRVLRQRGPLPEREALEIVRQTAQGLEYAWTHRIVHRDIKPQNILLTADGTAKICDLGLCRDTKSDGTLTASGIVNCTPAYVSPEAARGARDLDTRTDIYSLGVTLYELVTGTLPFQGDSAGDFIVKHVTEKPPAPVTRRPDLSPAVNRLILEMLEKSREARPPTPGALAARIADLLAGKEPAADVPPPRAPRTRRTAGPPRSALSLPPLPACFAVGLALLAALWMFFNAGPPTPPAPEPTRPAPLQVPAPPTAGRPKDPAADAIESLEAFAVSATDPAAILLRCDEVRSQLKGTAYEARLQAVEERALLLKSRVGADDKADAFLADIRRTIERDTEFRRRAEVLRMLESAAGTRRAEAERLRMDYDKAYDEAGRRAAADLRASAQSLSREQKFAEALTRLREYPATLPASHRDSLESTRREIEARWSQAMAAEACTIPPARTLPRPAAAITSLGFAPDGKTLALAGADATGRLWDMAGNRERASLNGHRGQVAAVAFAPDGRTLATACEAGTSGEIRLWDSSSGELRASRDTGPLVSLSFSPDGKAIAAGGKDGRITIRDGSTLHETGVLKGTGPIQTLAFSPDGKHLASGGPSQPVQLWSPVTGDRGVVFGIDAQDAATCLAFSPDGETLAAGTWRGSLFVWDVAKARLRVALQAHPKTLKCLAFSPGGALLATADDASVRIWDAETLVQRATLPAGARALAFSPTAKLLAGAGDDGAVRLWDMSR